MVSKKELQNKMTQLNSHIDGINIWIKSIIENNNKEIKRLEKIIEELEIEQEIISLVCVLKDYKISDPREFFRNYTVKSLQDAHYKLVKIFDDKRQLWIKDDPKEKPKDQKQDTKKVVNQKNKKTRRK